MVISTKTSIFISRVPNDVHRPTMRVCLYFEHLIRSFVYSGSTKSEKFMSFAPDAAEDYNAKELQCMEGVMRGVIL